MNRIFGVLNFDSRPIEQEAFQAMADRLARKSHHDVSWICGEIGLGIKSTYKETKTPQTLRAVGKNGGSLHLVLDGRIDNREQLREEIENRGFCLESGSDSEIVLR